MQKRFIVDGGLSSKYASGIRWVCLKVTTVVILLFLIIRKQFKSYIRLAFRRFFYFCGNLGNVISSRPLTEEIRLFWSRVTSSENIVTSGELCFFGLI